MNMQYMELECPVCKSKDKIRFAFIEHYEHAKDETDISSVNPNNPGDDYNLFMCSSNHIFTDDGQIYLFV